MAKGNLGKKGKKGKKRVIDPYSRKDWYDVKAPNNFSNRNFGKTLVTRTIGTKLASDGLKGRVFEVCQADLNQDEADSFRNIKLRSEDVQGRNVLTNFWGMSLTTDKLRSLVRKWQTMIEASVDVKTSDAYIVRVFTIGFTRRQRDQVSKTSYAQSSQIRRIRARMVSVVQAEAAGCDYKELVKKLLNQTMPTRIVAECERIYPLRDVYIRKVKVLRAPKFDSNRLMEAHAETVKEDKGKAVEATPAAQPATA